MKDDWFSRLTGFKEDTYAASRERLQVNGSMLHSKVNGRSYGIGQFEMVSLAELRDLVHQGHRSESPTRTSMVEGDVRQMHQQSQDAGALFQVASQFNALEMVGPSVTPEDGVTRYEYDRTQGPACAIAAGAATIYRNYFAQVGDQTGQTRAHQLDGLSDVEAHLSKALGCPVADLCRMQNGYALPTLEGLGLITAYLRDIGQDQRRELEAFCAWGCTGTLK